MKRKLVFIFLILLMVIAPIFAAGQKEDAVKVYKLRTSTNMAEVGTIGKALTKFTELVNEKSNGRIVATANYGAELGNQAEQVEMCRTGSLEMVVSAPGTGPGTWVPQFMMFEFPFIFKDNAHYRRVFKGMESEVSALTQPYGMIAMAGQSLGSRHMLTKKPVTKLADLKNMKMRGPNAVYISMFEHLGAAGTTTDWNEIYTALQTGIVDGMEASPSMINSMRFQDVAKNLTITDHILACTYYFFNEKWFNSLPADLQVIVREAAEEATAYQAKIDDIDQEASLAKMIAEGVVIHKLTDKADWIKACEPMLAQYRSKGPEWNSFIDHLLAIE